MVYSLLFIICPPFVTTNWPHFWPWPWSSTMHQEIINRAGEKISPFEAPWKSVFLFQIWHMDPKNLPREYFRIAEKSTCVSWFWTWNAFHNHRSWNAPDACLFVEGCDSFPSTAVTGGRCHESQWRVGALTLVSRSTGVYQPISASQYRLPPKNTRWIHLDFFARYQ